MKEVLNPKVNKRQYWQDQIKLWQSSNLSQSSFCSQSGINLSTFTYWRSILAAPSDKKNNKFVAVKVVKDEIVENEAIKSIEIKLLTGHIIYLPVEIGINEITKLIHLLGLPNA